MCIVFTAIGQINNRQIRFLFYIDNFTYESFFSTTTSINLYNIIVKRVFYFCKTTRSVNKRISRIYHIYITDGNVSSTVVLFCFCFSFSFILFSLLSRGEISGENMSRYCFATVISNHIFLASLEKRINVAAGK